MKTSATARWTDLTVQASDARGLKALYFNIEYDAACFSPVSAQASGLLAADGEQVLDLAVMDSPGLLQYGQVLTNWPEREGFSGSGILATVRFESRPFTGNVARTVSDAPITDLSSAFLQVEPSLGQLHWYYYHQGDYDQNGDTNITDLTPLGANFGAVGPFDFKLAISCVDGDDNGLITIADITPIGANFGRRVESYKVFSSNSQGDYPASNDGDNGPGAVSVDNVPFADAVFTVGFRKEFVLTPAVLVATDYYWVRPVHGLSVGTPSNAVIGSGNHPPTVNILGDVSGGNAPLHVIFTAVATDPDGTIDLYEWDLDGDAVYESSGTINTASFDYTVDGSYNATVRVTDNGLETATASQTISVVPVGANIPPFAVLVASPGLGDAPLLVTYDASGSSDPDGTITEYRFDFDGDGTDDLVTADPIQVFSLTVPGSYLADVEVFDDDGDSSTDVEAIQVNEGPHWRYDTIVASPDDVGNQSALFEIGGMPAIVYWNTTLRHLLLIKASDTLGATWALPETIDNSGLVGDSLFLDGSEISVLTVGGHPAVAYNLDKNLYFRRASDPNGGLPWGNPAIELDSEATGHTGQWASMALVNSNPAIAYHDDEGGRLRFIRASSADGADWFDAIVTVDSGPGFDMGQSASLAYTNSVPSISYYNDVSMQAKFAHSSNINGASGWSNTTTSVIAELGATGTALLDSAGLPGFFAASALNGKMYFVRADDGTFATWTAVDCFPAETGSQRSPSAFLGAGGIPLLALFHAGAGEPGVTTASDEEGTAFLPIQVADDTFDLSSHVIGEHPSLAVIDGKLCISYYDQTNTNLKFSIFY